MELKGIFRQKDNKNLAKCQASAAKCNLFKDMQPILSKKQPHTYIHT